MAEKIEKKRTVEIVIEFNINDEKIEYLLAWKKKKGALEFVVGGLMEKTNYKPLHPYFVSLFKGVSVNK